MKYLCALALVFVGCVSSSSRPIIGPDGSTAYRLTCHPDIADCWEEAGNDCGGHGYYVVSKSMHWGGTVADLMPGPVRWYNVMIECKE